MTVAAERIAPLLAHVRPSIARRIERGLVQAEREGMGIDLDPVLSLSPAQRIVREGFADVLAWLGQPVDPYADSRGPVFYEVQAPLLGAPRSLGSLCAVVNDAISDEFARYGLRPPSGLRAVITSGAMAAGGYDAALAYLLKWVDFERPED